MRQEQLRLVVRVALVAIVAAAAALGAACDEVAMPYQLEHARIVAVRSEPAALAPGQRGVVEILVTGAGGPRVAAAAAVTVTVRPELAAMVPLVRDGDTWTVTAPSAEQVAAARAALAVPADQPLALPLELATEVDGVALTAQKWIVIGAAAANPEIARVELDGAEIGTAVEVSAGTAPRLAVVHDAGEAAVVRWLSSVGDLEGYQTAAATLDAEAAASGAIVVVVRDGSGGTTWRIVPATVLY